MPRAFYSRAAGTSSGMHGWQVGSWRTTADPNAPRVGRPSGASPASAGLGWPTWSGLVDRMADDLAYNRAIFRSFGDPWTLAEYYKLKKGGVGQSRVWMERSWCRILDALAASPIHEVIVTLDFPTIYTTNYDHWIERAHDLHRRPCAAIVTVEDMATPKPDVTHVVKYQRDISNDASLGVYLRGCVRRPAPSVVGRGATRACAA